MPTTRADLERRDAKRPGLLLLLLLLLLLRLLLPRRRRAADTGRLARRGSGGHLLQCLKLLQLLQRRELPR